ncbi:hypothetical protein [Tritonibacter horizontis]|uniref:Uncharacterized protein n=1 Tax=Tritonibacter horizontis TaxID=1768241 RepID=A0A132BQE1_9RHOB|nr:hypothetical protein [Tritonibacter horizontis]KUP90629.1 hypothetical protein TRIHO_44950 [Tritonibacter horizontis]
MAILGLLFGMIAGLVTGSIAMFSFGLPFWICLGIYAIVGALSALSVTCIAYVLRSEPGADPSDQDGWSASKKQRTATG